MFVIFFDKAILWLFDTRNTHSLGVLYKPRLPGTIKAVAGIVMLSIVLSGLCQATEHSQDYNISAQSLNDALIQFAAETNLQLLFSADRVRGIEVKALSGTLSREQALHQLLLDTGLTYQFIDNKTVTIIPDAQVMESSSAQLATNTPVGSDSVKVLQPMTVVGKDKKFAYNTVNSDGLYKVNHSDSSTRTLTAIKETPQSIQVLSRTIIDDQQNLNISESLKNVSGVIPGDALLTPSFDATLIRGFKAEQLLDGFTQYYNSGDRESLVNVERIEVLKGSNAILYGGEQVLQQAA